MSTSSDDAAGARRLVATLLLRATQDAAGDDPFWATEARHYLNGEGASLAALLDIRPFKVKAWLRGLAEINGDLGQCVYSDWEVTELLGVPKAGLRRLSELGLLIPDAPGGRYSVVALLEFLAGERPDSPSPPIYVS